MNSTGTVIAIAPNMHQFIQAVPILGIINTDRNSNMGIIPNQNSAPVIVMCLYLSVGIAL